MRLSSERGFALPLTILVLALITLLLAAAFVRVAAERRVGESGGDMVDALTIAQSGVYRYMEYRTSLNVAPPDGDSVFFASIPPGGTASVVARIAQLPTDPTEPALYLITSVGQRIDPGVGAEPRAVRTVTQLAKWRNTAITPTAALLAYQDVQTPDTTGGKGKGKGGGGAGTLVTVGTDQSSCNRPTITDFDGNGIGGGNSALISNVGIDWRTIDTAGYAADYTSLVNLGSWASYLISGDATLSQSGNGLLVVRRRLTTTGVAITWNGVVLVGDSAVFSANNTTINGILITGLNDVLPGPNPGPSIVSPLKTLQVLYHSCRVDSAMGSLTGFNAISNTWFDRWMGN